VGLATGGVLRSKEGTAGGEYWDLVFFKPFPLKELAVKFKERIQYSGDKNLWNAIDVLGPARLKQSDLYWEFDGCRITKNKVIKARNVFPFVLTLPGPPFKKFSITRGGFPEKSRLYFKNIGISTLDGLSLSLLYRVRAPFARGDYTIKFYERELMDAASDVKRGVMISGENDWLIKGRRFLSFSALANTGDESFNLDLKHQRDTKHFNYSLAQKVSGRENTPAVYSFTASFWLKKMAFLSPKFEFYHNLKSSYSYQVSTPVRVARRLTFNLDFLRKLLREETQVDTTDFSASMNFSSSLFDLNSVYHFSENMLQASQTNNFNINLNPKPIRLLDGNVSMSVNPFYAFTTLPGEVDTTTHTTPGINAELKSFGLSLPLGLVLYPTLNISHLWDNLDIDQTNFNYLLSLKRDFGSFGCSLDYSLVSRYRSENFWVEGYNVKNMNFSLEWRKVDRYSLGLRLYYNNQLALENVTLSGEVFFPWKIRFSSFFLYYVDPAKFQTVEVFVEKKFSNLFKLQCGYSLSQKRFFVKFFTL
jgi:hypothetical protein